MRWLFLFLSAMQVSAGPGMTLKDPSFLGTLQKSSSGTASTPWITSFTPTGTLQNGPYIAGCRFFTAAASFHVTQLGMWCYGTNSQSHTIYLTDASGNSLGSCTVNLYGQATGWVYGSITPVALSPSTSYVIGATYASSGDQFLYLVAVPTVTSIASINYYAYVSGNPSPPFSWTFGASSGDYGATFQYTIP